MNNDLNQDPDRVRKRARDQARDRDLVVGLDAGGTRTRAVLASAVDGRVLGQGLSGPGNALTVPVPLLTEHLAEAVARAVPDPDRARVVAVAGGFAGAAETAPDEPGRLNALAALTAALRRLGIAADSVGVSSDIEAAFASAPGAPADGLALVAGTGAVAMRIIDRRCAVTVGGDGWLLGDDGGGFWIGRSAVRAALRMADGRGGPTTLADAVGRALGVPAEALPYAEDRLVGGQAGLGGPDGLGGERGAGGAGGRDGVGSLSGAGGWDGLGSPSGADGWDGLGSPSGAGGRDGLGNPSGADGWDGLGSPSGAGGPDGLGTPSGAGSRDGVGSPRASGPNHTAGPVSADASASPSASTPVSASGVSGTARERLPAEPEWSSARRAAYRMHLLPAVMAEPPIHLARLAPLVAGAARHQDAVARAILDEAADHLLELVRALAPRKGERIVATGGLLGPEGPLTALLSERLKALGLTLDWVADGCGGAVALARLGHGGSPPSSRTS
ncbi:BadF/BadG/BcrA/BcrD ATPase family protein [Streptomyces phaeochromogenes]|uniref:BadF/BadG/BcrA/BcrD ATPase family protein n=1 Tax=Streptomyces phaeochromogenes TaxID=1923 RepID=UPI002E0FD698|nr:ATPase [Streptomyces phaeochromogenes]